MEIELLAFDNNDITITPLPFYFCSKKRIEQKPTQYNICKLYLKKKWKYPSSNNYDNDDANAPVLLLLAKD
jgi:hypothetical protein